jgi:16S rRNA (guanine966-N2)-methyltransferase
MRIIAGSAKGTRLGPVPDGTRPVSDRAREGLFASLGEAVAQALVLDLFAGTGALGIEALSRGATSAVFVDRSRAAARAIRANLQLTGLTELGRVIVADVPAYVRERPPGTAPFDLVFLDPPYQADARSLTQVLGALDRGWLAPGWTVVVTRGHKGPLPAPPLHWNARRQLRYGDSLLICYREVAWA